jgi:hypothetical protein
MPARSPGARRPELPGCSDGVCRLLPGEVMPRRDGTSGHRQQTTAPVAGEDSRVPRSEGGTRSPLGQQQCALLVHAPTSALTGSQNLASVVSIVPFAFRFCLTGMRVAKRWLVRGESSGVGGATTACAISGVTNGRCRVTGGGFHYLVSRLHDQPSLTQ